MREPSTVSRPALSPLRLALLSACALLALAGCKSLEPELPAARPDIPQEWAAASPAGASVADLGWRDFFTDARLARVIAQALDNNRDLRVAALNVQRARALYGVQSSERYPGATAGGAITRSAGTTVSTVYSANLAASWELDFFGRIASLTEAALRTFLAQEQAARSVRLALVADVASLWLTLATDRELQRISQATLANQKAAFRLTERRYELGAVSALDLAQARSQVEGARAEVARTAGLVATDLNALRLLVGGTPAPADLPQSFDPAVSGVAPLPAGVPSEVLLRRPDIAQAELALRAANANIGAARAAYFPTISLTGSIGVSSRALDDLFDYNSRAWSFVPSLRLPIFQGQRLDNNLAAVTADRDIALARYEKAVQSGFREVSDALALTGTLRERRAALAAQLAAATRAEAVARLRYEGGRDSFTTLLDAQRTLYATQTALTSVTAAEQINRITLYRVLGGGWK